MTNEEILADYPYLEVADIHAALRYATRIANARTIVALPLVSCPAVVKFLVDTQLPPRLATYLAWKGFDAIHTTHFSEGCLSQDTAISRITLDEDRIFVTRDADFPNAFLLKGPPPRIIYLRLGNVRNRDLTAFSEIRWPTIQALIDEAAGMLVVSKERVISY